MVSLLVLIYYEVDLFSSPNCWFLNTVHNNSACMLVTHMLTNQDSMEVNFSNFRAKLRSLKPDLCKHKKKTFQKHNSPIITCSAWWWGWLLYVDVLMLISKLLIVINQTLTIIITSLFFKIAYGLLLYSWKF